MLDLLCKCIILYGVTFSNEIKMSSLAKYLGFYVNTINLELDGVKNLKQNSTLFIKASIWLWSKLWQAFQKLIKIKTMVTTVRSVAILVFRPSHGKRTCAEIKKMKWKPAIFEQFIPCILRQIFFICLQLGPRSPNHGTVRKSQRT